MVEAPATTRFAPSPTGHLHLGHVLHMIWTWGVAQLIGSDIKFRIEDHDRSRCKPEFEHSIIQDLTWLGFAIDASVTWRQSDRQDVYQRQFQSLASRHLIYACTCSRSDIARATGQQSGELRYPGTCRHKSLALDTPNSTLRILMPSKVLSANDLMAGHLDDDPSRSCGDIAIRDRDGSWTYQFCVVIDDLEQRINLVIRGADLITSTSRQLALRHLIDPLATDPIFLHHPLIQDPAGHKLSKRFGATAIATLREEGWSPERLIGHIATIGGLTIAVQPIKVGDLAHIVPLGVRENWDKWQRSTPKSSKNS